MSSINSNSPAVARRSVSRPAAKAVLVFVVSFLGLAMTMLPGVFEIFDEGIILTGAMRVAAGQVPHRDFYAIYGPGQFYVLASLFNLFGQMVLVERLYDLVVKAGIVSFVSVLSCQLMRPAYAALAAAFCMLWIAVMQFPVYPIWPSLLLILASIWILLPLFYGPYSATRLFSAGLCAGAVTLFRYDMGLLTLAIFSAALVFFSLIEPSSVGSRAPACINADALLGRSEPSLDRLGLDLHKIRDRSRFPVSGHNFLVGALLGDAGASVPSSYPGRFGDNLHAPPCACQFFSPDDYPIS
jgi:hypothetical protein